VTVNSIISAFRHGVADYVLLDDREPSMPSEAPPNHESVKGLPLVAPPSGKFLIQLFLVPGLIVAFALAVVWGFGWLVGGSYSAEEFLKDLRNPNTEFRWRRANDLAQVLPRDKTLAANSKFALDLTELLQNSLRDNLQNERAWAERTKSGTKTSSIKPDKSLEEERAFIQYLIPCLGYLALPTGVPILEELTLAKEGGADPETIQLRRRLTVLALANLAESLKYLDTISSQQRQEIIATLQAEESKGSSERRLWSELAAEYVQARQAGDMRALGVDRTLVECVKPSHPASNDPILRERVAFALNLWEGNQEENRRMEETLLQLTYDDGRGATASEAPVRGLEIRYKAVEGLARRGSDLVVKRFGILEEMLDEERQREIFRFQSKSGQEMADEALVSSTVRGALRGITELHRKKPELDLSSFQPPIDKLLTSSNPELRAEAERTRALIARDRK
jgi:hypothetical protein